MKQFIVLGLVLTATLFAHATPKSIPTWDEPLYRHVSSNGKCYSIYFNPTITYYSVEGYHTNPSDPNSPWSIRMFIETDYPVPYQQACDFHIKKWQQFSYGWPRQTQWIWVWNTYSIYLPPNATSTYLDDTFKPGETYDFQNYDACCLQKFP